MCQILKYKLLFLLMNFDLPFLIASATVVPCLTTLISGFGGMDQKGVVLGVFRSLGALARAFGPVLSSIGRYIYTF